MAELQKLHSEEEMWKTEVRQQMASPDEKDGHFVQVAKNRTELFDRLKKAMALRIKGKNQIITYIMQCWTKEV